MSKSFTIELGGIDKVIKGIASLSEDLQTEVKNELKQASENVAGGARRRAAANFGGGSGLRSGITDPQKLDEFTFSVASTKEYSPYVEFGTGGLVDVPKGLEDYAMQFKGKGIREVNLPARPFFFNTLEEERVDLIKRLKNIIKNI